MKGIIIGSGIGGLAAAIRLAKKGYEVSVFEANTYPGGKLSEIWVNSYRFDTGPSLFTLPGMVDELFQLCNENPAEHFAYKRLDIICKYFYEDGTIIRAWQDIERFAEELSEKTGEKKINIYKFLDKSKLLYELTSDVFIFKSFHQLKTWISRGFLKSILYGYKLNVFNTMDGVISKYFRDPRVRQLFDRYATYNGSNPFATPGTLNVIPNLEYNIGAFIPVKGMFDITRSMVNLAERQRVNFHFNSRVDEILVKQKKVTGINSGGQFYPADVIISDIDIVSAYKLLKEYQLPQRYLRQERSSSALVFYWGVKDDHPDLELHNILFSQNYREEFEYLFKKKEIYADPTVYINISSKEVNGDAPSGSENWFTMINAPVNAGQDWDRLISEVRVKIMEKIKRLTGIDIENKIDAEDILHPGKIEQLTSSYRGSLYGNSSNSIFSAFNRHPNFSRSIKNLYFIGGSVHPGGGIPLCLASAKIADSLIK